MQHTDKCVGHPADPCQWQCIEAVSTSVLNLSIAAVVPEFTSGLRKVAAVEGKTARFECEVSGQPKPDIQW